MVQNRQEHDPRVVVGVDGSDRNVAAVEWAATEARSRDVGLVLVGVASPGSLPPTTWTADATLQYPETETAALLRRVASRLRARADAAPVDTTVRVGDPAHELRDATSPADVVVVGRRGIGLVERVVLGSTSVALAGSSRGPVVIVPDDWATDRATDGADGGHVVAGVDGTERDNAVLEFAFARADRDHLPLDVVAAAELPAVYGWETTEVERWVKEAQTRLGERMEPWVHRFPSVDLRCHTPLTNPAIALLDAAEGAALIVVGRYAGSHHLSAFSGLSTARRVLHHAACPVAVVPVGTSDPETFRFDETDVPQF